MRFFKFFWAAGLLYHMSSNFSQAASGFGAGTVHFSLLLRYAN